MNMIQNNSGLDNIDALLQEIHNEISRDSSESMSTHQKLLKTYLKRGKFLRQDKISKMRERIDVTDVKDKIKKKIPELAVSKEIEGIKKWVKSLFTKLSNVSDQGDRQNQRVLRILNDIDESKTNSVDHDQGGDVHASAAEMGGRAIDEALIAQIELKHDSEKNQEVQRRIQNNQVENQIDRQKGAIKGQLDAMKKAKLFGKFFQIFQIVASIVVTALTAGAGSPLAVALNSASKFLQMAVSSLIQSVYGMLMQALQSAGMKPFQDKMISGQTQEQNANEEMNKLIQNIVRDESDFQRSQSKTNEMISVLENAQIQKRR